MAIDIKQHLILTAMDLFAEQGVAAVSMREVNRAAGAKNNSAAHYHFGDKAGLVDAVIAFIQDWFVEARLKPLGKLEAAAAAGPITVRDVLDVWARPYVRLMTTEPWGYAAVRMLAHIQFELDSLTREAHNRLSQEAINRFTKLVLKSVPELPKELMLHRFNYCVISIVQNLANSRLRAAGYYESYEADLEALLEMYLDFAAAGMAAPSNIKPNSRTYKRLARIESFLYRPRATKPLATQA
ncbi:hypothetical protein FQZ97_416520 [compost metagenome]